MPGKTRPCERCKTMIPPERIEAVPETRLCVQCSQTVGGEFELRVTPENLAKTGSLKKNYGSWTIEKRRKRPRPEAGN
ncbi:MAG: TraR/DksA C4-type zinc finger protein [Planctomycetia bacterium]|nr:TraR/DksA C4-type zinc finger protein [Planctomycetia bacterium]